MVIQLTAVRRVDLAKNFEQCRFVIGSLELRNQQLSVAVLDVRGPNDLLEELEVLVLEDLRGLIGNLHCNLRLQVVKHALLELFSLLHLEDQVVAADVDAGVVQLHVLEDLKQFLQSVEFGVEF